MGGPYQPHHLPQHLLLLLAPTLLTSCATLPPSPEQAAWATICHETPITEGHTYSREEVQAMNTVKGWSLSVEQINARCQ